MAATPSTMLPLGTPVPPLRLPDAATGATVDAVAATAGRKGLLVAFICNHCPYVKHILGPFVRLAHAAIDEGFAVVAVSSNDARAYPEDGPAEMAALARRQGWRFPYLYDETQGAARAFQAACTPDLYLFDAQGRLAYRGEFDDSRPGNGKPVTGAPLRAALDAVAAGRTPAADQRPSIGCNIKWKR